MKTIVFNVRKKVINPVPLRSLSLDALQREERSLTALLKLSGQDNRREFERIEKVRKQKTLDALEQACKSIGAAVLAEDQLEAVCESAVKDGPQLRPDHDYVVSKDLLDLMALRLKLCRAEISRCKQAQRNR